MLYVRPEDICMCPCMFVILKNGNINFKVQILLMCTSLCALVQTTKNGSLPEVHCKAHDVQFCLDCVLEVLIQIYGEFEADPCGVEMLLFMCLNR